MADSFGLKIGLEGEKEFKKALADINQSFKVFCDECGGKCMRKKIYGEVWYGCDTHVKDKKKCR